MTAPVYTTPMKTLLIAALLLFAPQSSFEVISVKPGDPNVKVSTPSLFEILEEVERRIIVDMLERTNWNQTEASERFQVPLSTLNQKIKRLGIETRRRPFPPRGPGYPEDSAEFAAGK